MVWGYIPIQGTDCEWLVHSMCLGLIGRKVKVVVGLNGNLKLIESENFQTFVQYN